jgi:hypothetical protein
VIFVVLDGWGDPPPPPPKRRQTATQGKRIR